MSKKVIAIQDLSGFGRAALTTVISALTTLQIQVCPSATAVFSSHTALKNYSMIDLSDLLPKTLEQWKGLNVKFDSIYSGFLSSENQIDSVIEYINTLDTNLVFIDPVMGDKGKIYKTYTENMCCKVKELCSCADIITPNLTELLILTSDDFTKLPTNEDEIIKIINKLDYKAKIIVTGIEIKDDKIGIAIAENGNISFIYHDKVPAYFPGTGDLFASIVLGLLLNNFTLTNSVEVASNFVYETILYTRNLGTDPLFGVELEENLYKLSDILRG